MYLRETSAKLILAGVFIAFTLGSLITSSYFPLPHRTLEVPDNHPLSHQCQQLIQSPIPFLASTPHNMGAARSQCRHNAAILDEPVHLPDLALIEAVRFSGNSH